MMLREHKVSAATMGALGWSQVGWIRDSMGAAKPNERMQLTWLTGAPIRAGLGSPASRRAGRPRFSRHAADAGR